MGGEGGGRGDGEKRRVTTPMEKKIERTESAERIFQRGNFVITREGRGGAALERPAGRNEIVSRFSSSATGAETAPPRPRTRARARGGITLSSIRIGQPTSCTYFTRLPSFSCYFKYRRSRAPAATLNTEMKQRVVFGIVFFVTL